MKFDLHPGMMVIIHITMVKKSITISFTYSKIISIIQKQKVKTICRTQFDKHQILYLYRKDKTIQKLLYFVTVMLILLMNSRGRCSLINIKHYFPNCKFPSLQSEKVRIMLKWNKWLIIEITTETFARDLLILNFLNDYFSLFEKINILYLILVQFLNKQLEIFIIYNI